MAVGSGPRRVFTYWEPRGAVTPYLELCRETWDRSLAGAEIVTGPGWTRSWAPA